MRMMRIAFGVILNFLRTGQVHYGSCSRELVLEEAKFYGVPIDETLDPAVQIDMVNLDLQGEKNIISVFRKATLSSWREYSVKTIKKMMPKLYHHVDLNFNHSPTPTPNPDPHPNPHNLSSN